MKLLKFIFHLSLLASFIINGTMAQERAQSAQYFVNDLKDEGLLSLTDRPAINIFLEQTCENSLPLNLDLQQKEKLFCEVVTKSDTCLEIPKNDLRQCSQKNTEITAAIDIVVGCAKGLFNSVKELLSFLWQSAKFIWENVTDWDKASDTADSVNAFAQSIKLYLYTEYDKAYDKAEFPKALNAAREVSSEIFKFLGTKITEILEDQYTKFGCLNAEAKTRKVCHVMGDLILPPAAFFAFLKRGVGAAKEFPSLNKAFDGLNSTTRLSDYRARLKNADEILARELGQAQQEAVVRAHLVGVGEVGIDGTLAKVGNYTFAQLRRKNAILKEAGLTKEEIRKLMEAGVVGIGPDEFAKIPKDIVNARSPIAPDMRPEYESVRIFLREGRVPKDPYVSFVAPNGARLPAKMESYDPLTGQSVVALADGRRVTLTADQLSSIRQSSSAKESLQEVQRQFIPAHPDDVYESIRSPLREGKIPTDPHVSFVSPTGLRLAAKIENVDASNNSVLLRLENGQTHTLSGEDLLTLRQSSSSKDFFTTTSSNRSREFIPPSSDPKIAPLREALNYGVVPNDPFVSVVTTDGARVAAKIESVDTSTQTIKLTFVDGSTEIVSGQRLQTLRFSETSKDAFNANSFRYTNPPDAPGARLSSASSAPSPRADNIYNENYKLPENINQVGEDFKKVRDQVFPKFDTSEIQPKGKYLSNGYWWVHLGTHDVNIPQQGWKLHVSAKPENMGKIAQDLVPELQRRGIHHKVVGNFEKYAEMAGTTHSQQGKFITVYPRTTEEAIEYGRLLKEIIQKRGYKSEDFLNIPNEMELAPGVFGRYGRLLGGDLVRPDGSVIKGTDDFLLTPDGQVILDARGQANPSFVEPLEL